MDHIKVRAWARTGKGYDLSGDYWRCPKCKNLQESHGGIYADCYECGQFVEVVFYRSIKRKQK